MKISVKKLVTSAIIGALYAAITMALGFCSYGPIQFRIAEVLCILPFFAPGTVVGLTIGCAVANLLSSVGVLDIVFGSLATLMAGLCVAGLGSRYRRARLPGQGNPAVGWGRCVAVCAMPVVFNVPIVGAVLSYVLFPREEFWQGVLIFGTQVGLGEAAVMLVLGLPAFRYFLKRPDLEKLL